MMAGLGAARETTSGMVPGTLARRRDPDSAGAGRTVVKRLRLRRRRSQVPWIYAVYHARLGQGSAGAEPLAIAESPRARARA
jgi:hypothetical protein